jgi:hypothetical protein
VIRQRKDRDGLQVQVYAGRDPLTGRKRWVSRQVPTLTKRAQAERAYADSAPTERHPAALSWRPLQG